MTTTTTTTTNRLDGKTFSKMLSYSKKQSVSTLSNGVKQFVRLHGNSKANAELFADKVLDKTYTKAQVNTFTDICRNKELLFRVCKAILPTIDGIYIEFQVQETFFKDLGTSTSKSDRWIKERPITGNEYKPWGVGTETKQLNNKPLYLIADNETYKRVSVAVSIEKFTEDKIGKCIKTYLDLADDIKAKL